MARCPDIGVKGIRFDIRRSAPFRGEVRITAVVVNGSDVPFESRASQQSLQLYEVPMGGSARLVAEQRFAILQPGRTVSVAYTRNWNASSPAEGEFPPSYRALILFDPDIRADGNPRNDDCRSSNDSAERSGSDINALFR